MALRLTSNNWLRFPETVCPHLMNYCIKMFVADYKIKAFFIIYHLQAYHCIKRFDKHEHSLFSRPERPTVGFRVAEEYRRQQGLWTVRNFCFKVFLMCKKIWKRCLLWSKKAVRCMQDFTSFLEKECFREWTRAKSFPFQCSAEQVC